MWRLRAYRIALCRTWRSSGSLTAPAELVGVPRNGDALTRRRLNFANTGGLNHPQINVKTPGVAELAIKTKRRANFRSVNTLSFVFVFLLRLRGERRRRKTKTVTSRTAESGGYWRP